MPAVTYVVPCFNEAQRLDADAWVDLVDRDERIALLLVNDGSNDDTGQLIDAVAARSPRITATHLADNRGKAEAVRIGMLAAIADGASIVGYADADLSTPPSELARLCDEIANRSADAVLGARVAHLGAHIDRRWSRHVLGRVFATCASLILDLPVYDTQCGAKLFRVTAALSDALHAPFRSRWAFDVELLGRLSAEPDIHIVEVPLKHWAEVGGSKLRAAHMLRAGLDLAHIAIDLRGRRRGQSRTKSPGR